MKINKIDLENFRNYKAQSFEFSSGVNVLFGNNGQGKTNVIEALYYFCNGRSYRALKDREIININSDYADFKVFFESFGRDNTAHIRLDKSKIIKLNDINIKKLSELIGYLKAVLFTPDFLDLVKDGPSKRRNFFDSFISLIYPVYFKCLMKYNKVLKQKNIALKNREVDDVMLDIWNEELAKYGSVVCKYRKYIIEKINVYIKKYQFEMSSGKEELKIAYSPSVKDNFVDRDYFYEMLKKNKEREKYALFAIIGPHRDDYDFYINDMHMKNFASQGQIRTAVLSLMLSQSEVIKEIFGEYPILLLDDIMSELDEKRRAYLLDEIKDKQVIITCTDKESFGNKDVRFFEIENGKVKET